jgi:PST family polysaccharide transporter
LVSLVIIYFKFNISFITPNLFQIKRSYIGAWHLFLSTLTVSLYTNTNTILLGFLTSPAIVGIYALAFTITSAVLKIIKLYNLVVYPYLAKLSDQKNLLIRQARLMLRLYVGILGIFAFLTFITASVVINTLFGSGNEASIVILMILSISIVFEPLGGFFTSYLVIKDQKKLIPKITFWTSLFNFIIVLPAIYYYNAVGLACTLLIVNIFQVMLNGYHNKELLMAEGCV